MNRSAPILSVAAAVALAVVALLWAAPPTTAGPAEAPSAPRAEIEPALAPRTGSGPRPVAGRAPEALPVTTAEARQEAQGEDDAVAARNRQRVFGANIDSLYDAAEIAEEAGNGARAALMRKRAAALEARMLAEEEAE